MDKQLFRQKSLDHISSPEELHDYMRVTSPRLWMILTAIVLLLGGFIIYAATARMESTETIRLRVDCGSIMGYIPEGRQDLLPRFLLAHFFKHCTFLSKMAQKLRT